MRLGAGVSSRGGLDGTSGMISSAAASLTLALTMAFTPPESTAIEWAVTETLGLPGPAPGMVTPVPLPAAIGLMALACVVLATGGRLPGGGSGANGTRRRSCAASC